MGVRSSQLDYTRVPAFVFDQAERGRPNPTANSAIPRSGQAGPPARRPVPYRGGTSICEEPDEWENQKPPRRATRDKAANQYGIARKVPREKRAVRISRTNYLRGLGLSPDIHRTSGFQIFRNRHNGAETPSRARSMPVGKADTTNGVSSLFCLYRKAFPNTSMICRIAGVIKIIRIEGKIKIPIGKIILTGALWASSSAR